MNKNILKCSQVLFDLYYIIVLITKNCTTFDYFKIENEIPNHFYLLICVSCTCA